MANNNAWTNTPPDNLTQITPKDVRCYRRCRMGGRSPQLLSLESTTNRNCHSVSSDHDGAADAVTYLVSNVQVMIKLELAYKVKRIN